MSTVFQVPTKNNRRHPLKKLIALLSVSAACLWLVPSALAIQSVTADANSSDTTGAHFTGDFTLTVPSGTNTGSTSVTTATDNTGSLMFAGTSTVAGTVGSSASVRLKGIGAGVNESTVRFNGNVFAVTTTLGGNGTITFGDNANLTSAVTTATNNTGSLNFLGTSLITGQVGTSTAKIATITGGTVGERVTFANDVFATTTKVVGTGTLTFNGDVTSDVVLGGNGLVQFGNGADLTGAVTTTSAGTGSLLFDGTSSVSGNIGAGAALSAVTVEGGVVTINGGTYTVNSTLIRTNTAAGVSGTLKLGNNVTVTGVTTINGTGAFDASQYVATASDDFVLNSGSTLKTTIISTGATSSTAGHVVASAAAGDAQVVATGLVDVNVTSGAYVSNGQVYMLVDGHAAGSGVNSLSTEVTDNSATLSFTAAENGTSNDLVLTATRANLSTLATDANSSAVGATLNGFSSGAMGDMATVMSNLDIMPSASSYSAAVNQLDPGMNGGVNQASFGATTGALGTVSNRLDNARAGMVNGNGQTGMSTGDEFTDGGLWTQGFGSFADQDDKGGVTGYDASTWGVAGGWDWRMDERSRLGVSFAYANSNVDTNDSLQTTEVDTYQGSVYGTYEADAWYLDGMFAFGWNAYDSDRTIQFASINRVANQDYDGQQYSTQWTFGYPLALADNWSLVPMVSLLYSHLALDGFTEAGADSLNLTVEDQSYDFLQQGLGAKIVTEWTDASKQKWMPSFHALWLYDYIGDQASSTATFAAGGSSFTTNGLEPEQSSLNAGAGLTVWPTESLSLGVNYEFEYRSDYTSHGGHATVRYEF
jgi:outer membrane autotransporter protein